MAQLSESLAQVPLFSDLNKRQLRKLASGFKEKSFAPGRTVVREGHMDGVGFFVITEGRAAVSVSGSNVAIIGPGDYFGELAMLTEQERGATVTGRNTSPCSMMAFWDFRRFAKDNPDVSWKLLQHLAQHADGGSRPTRPSGDPSQLTAAPMMPANVARRRCVYPNTQARGLACARVRECPLTALDVLPQ